MHGDLSLGLVRFERERRNAGVKRKESCNRSSWRWPGSAANVENVGVSRRSVGGYERQPWRVEAIAVHGRDRS